MITSFIEREIKMNTNTVDSKGAELITSIGNTITDVDVRTVVLTKLVDLVLTYDRDISAINATVEELTNAHTEHNVNMEDTNVVVYRDIRQIGDSYIVQYTILSNKFAERTDNEVAIVLFNEFDDFYMDSVVCKHEYDCCGHWYPNKPVIFRGGSNSSATVITQSFYQNV